MSSNEDIRKFLLGDLYGKDCNENNLTNRYLQLIQTNVIKSCSLSDFKEFCDLNSTLPTCEKTIDQLLLIYSSTFNSLLDNKKFDFFTKEELEALLELDNKNKGVLNRLKNLFVVPVVGKHVLFKDKSDIIFNKLSFDNPFIINVFNQGKQNFNIIELFIYRYYKWSKNLLIDETIRKEKRVKEYKYDALEKHFKEIIAAITKVQAFILKAISSTNDNKYKQQLRELGRYYTIVKLSYSYKYNEYKLTEELYQINSEDNTKQFEKEEDSIINELEKLSAFDKLPQVHYKFFEITIPDRKLEHNNMKDIIIYENENRNISVTEIPIINRTKDTKIESSL